MAVIDTTQARIQLAGIPGFTKLFTTISEPGGSYQSTRYVLGDGSSGQMQGNEVPESITIKKVEEDDDATLLRWCTNPTYPANTQGVTISVTYFNSQKKLDLSTTKTFTGCKLISYSHSGADLNPEVPAPGMISLTLQPAKFESARKS